jgi:hypothetical protein
MMPWLIAPSFLRRQMDPTKASVRHFATREEAYTQGAAVLNWSRDMTALPNAGATRTIDATVRSCDVPRLAAVTSGIWDHWL